MATKAFYEQTTLRKLQLVETGMLKEFKKICEENNLDYFISFGTAIGVVRHKGFIPWDDDIDICMFRRDFDRFNEIVSKPPYSERYEMISAANSDDYLMPEAHWQLKGTRFVDKPSLEFKNPPGIFLDLFILDNLADDPKAAQKQMRDCLIWSRLMMVRAIKKPHIPYKGVFGSFMKVALFVLHYLMKIFCISKRWLHKKHTQASTRFNDQKTKYVTNFRVIDMKGSRLTLDDIYPLTELPFEDTTVNVVHEYHKQLTSLFGDYMQLPPVEKQHNHCPEILDFGDSLEYFGIE